MNTDRDLALAMARAAIPYFQDQWETKPNWYTESRLQTAKLTLQIMEDPQ